MDTLLARQRDFKTSKTMFTTTSRYVKRLDVSTLQSWIGTIVVPIHFNKISPLFTAQNVVLLIFLFLFPNFQVCSLSRFLVTYFVWIIPRFALCVPRFGPWSAQNLKKIRNFKKSFEISWNFFCIFSIFSNNSKSI